MRSRKSNMLRSFIHVDVVMLASTFAIFISSLSVIVVQADGNNIELTDFAKHQSYGQSVYSFYTETCCDIDEANSTCNKFGGFLAHVKTQPVWQLINQSIDIDDRDDYYQDMLWIGLHQVGDDNSLWKWSDGTPLENGRNNPNWQKDLFDEPSDPDEQCVGVATKRCRAEQSGTPDYIGPCSDDYVGKWGDKRCITKQKFICENLFGSGFVSKEIAVVGSAPDSIICVVFGDSVYLVSWRRNGEVISSNTDEPIYQQFDENTEYRTSTITFANPLVSDAGDYTCSLINKTSGIPKNFTVQLETIPYLSNTATLPPVHEISVTSNITCTARGRPIPTITWKIGGVQLEQNDDIFQVSNKINEQTLTTESVFSIINPISFEGNTHLWCVAEVEGVGEEVANAVINTDFGDFNGSSYTVDEITTETQCANVNGIFAGVPRKCYFVAAEMVDTEEEKCEGSELSIQIWDFTETATTTFTVTVAGEGSFYYKTYSTRSLQNSKTIRIGNLKPRSNYKIQFINKPKYWMTDIVNVTKIFQTTGKIPESMHIIQAKITSNDKCEVEFEPPSNIETSQLQWIAVNVTESGQNEDHYTTHDITYTNGMTSFSFNATSEESTYKFTAKFITCADDIGVETETIECTRAYSPPLAALIGGCVGGAVLLLLIIVSVLYYRRYKSEKPKTVAVEAKDGFTDIHKLKKLSVACESIHENKAFTTTPNGINSKCILENYKFLMASEKKELKALFRNLKNGTLSHDLARTACFRDKNKSKNRYKNIVPYDDTRVILSTDEGINSSDYINASWINGYQQKKRFIATQGPTFSTIDDFWRMIYETECKVIVMLTNLIEGKCEQYWPDRSRPYQSENFTIKFIMEQRAAAYTIRTFTITLNISPKEIRAVTQYQFVCWPVHGIPVITSPLLRFYNEVMEFANSSDDELNPIVVHCSAGVGRTGTFIALDILKEMLNNEDYVDIYQTVFDLRLQRMEMVQTLDQFAFLHKLVVESYLLGDSDYSITGFLKMLIDQDKLNHQLEEDFERLEWIPKIINDSENLVQVKGLKTVKDKRTSTLPQQKGDVYFNGSWIENFCGGRKIISAQTPQSATVETFLDVIVENSVSLVVMITDKGHKNLYWPKNEDTAKQFGDIYVRTTAVKLDKHFPTRTLTIVSSAQDLPPHAVELIQIESWKENGLTEDESNVLYNRINTLIQQIDAVWDDNSTILIHCKDGSNYSGSLCALLQIDERLKMENKVDLFRVVKDLRDIRPHMVRTLGQYKFCHWVTEAFIQSLHTYAYIK